MVTGILSYQNELGRTHYPLQPNTSVINNLIVDATLIQFDGFVPVLQSILVSATDLTITIQFDLLTLSFTYLQSSYTAGVRHVSIYDNLNSYNKRYLGRIVFGDGVVDLWNNKVSQLLTFGVPFIPSVVRSVPSTAGLFSLQGRFGTIELLGDPSMDSMFFTTNPSDNWIAFNGVGHFKLPDAPPSPALKLLNLVAPVDNNIFLGSNDIIKVSTQGGGGLSISLVGNTSVAADSIATTMSS
jgi:hypothetical protein